VTARVRAPAPSRWRQRLRRLAADLPVHLFLFLPNASVVFIGYYLVSNTLKPTVEFYRSEFAPPTTISVDALVRAVDSGGMLLALRNSIILAGVSTAIALFFGACAAYAFSRLRLPWKQILFVGMLVPMSISPMVVTIPLFAQMAELGLVNTFAGGIMIYVGLRISFVIYVLEGAFRELPDEIFEASRMDGASNVGTFFWILLPMAAPSLAAVGLFCVLETWNDLLIGLLFLSRPEVIPITANVVTFQQKFSADPQIIFAGLFMAALPLLVVYAFAQRFFVKGLSGAFK